MTYAPALQKEDLEQLKELPAHRHTNSSTYPILVKLEARILYVLQTLERETKERFDWYDYDTYNDKFRGYFDYDKYKENIGLYISHEVEPKLKLEYYSHIPMRFIFEDFEQEMKEAVAKARLDAQTEADHLQSLISSIKAKLTDEELALIRFHY